MYTMILSFTDNSMYPSSTDGHLATIYIYIYRSTYKKLRDFSPQANYTGEQPQPVGEVSANFS
jgi:hypothetical protein